MSGDFRIELCGNIYAAEARAALDDVLQRAAAVLRIGNATIDLDWLPTSQNANVVRRPILGPAIEMPSADPKGA
jgi:hypothetical protein